MRQIAYFSTAAEPQTAHCLHEILSQARAKNRSAGITGLLVAGGNRYMQVIEGPSESLRDVYASIRRDFRHLAVTTLLDRPILQRSFADWSMAFRREPELGRFDSFPQTLRYLTRQVEDRGLRGQIELFARTFIAAPAAETPWGTLA